MIERSNNGGSKTSGFTIQTILDLEPNISESQDKTALMQTPSTKNSSTFILKECSPGSRQIPELCTMRNPTHWTSNGNYQNVLNECIRQRKSLNEPDLQSSTHFNPFAQPSEFIKLLASAYASAATAAVVTSTSAVHQENVQQRHQVIPILQTNPISNGPNKPALSPTPYTANYTPNSFHIASLQCTTTTNPLHVQESKLMHSTVPNSAILCTRREQTDADGMTKTPLFHPRQSAHDYSSTFAVSTHKGTFNRMYVMN